MLSCTLTRMNVRINHFANQLICEKDVSYNSLCSIVVGLEIDYHTKRNPSKPHKNSIDTEKDPRGFHKQTTLIQCFTDTKAHSIKAPNNILVKHLVNGLVGTLTTSCSSGPFRFSADTTGTLSENEKLSEKIEQQESAGAAGEFKTSTVAITGCQKICLIEND